MRKLIATATILAFGAGFVSFLEMKQPQKKEILGDKEEAAEIIFGGDMLFDRYIRKMMRAKGEDYIFSCILKTLKDADLVVANLEGPITHNSSVSTGSVVGSPENFTFTFPTTTASLLKRNHITLVNLGNNHILNFGKEGLVETKNLLNKAGVSYFGDPESLSDFRVQVKNSKLAFISYNQFGGDLDESVSQVEIAVQEGYLPIVYAHWGNEYEKRQPELMGIARLFVDSGASVVIGSHPHVIGETEVYKGKPIFYSLGNFVFDQYFSKEVSNGALLKMTFGKDGAVFWHKIPIVMKPDGRTCTESELTGFIKDVN